MASKKTKSVVCEYCGNEIVIWTGSKTRFCSNVCHSEYKYKKYIEDWFAGLVSGGIKPGYGKVSKYVRRYLFEKYEDKCSSCGWSGINKFTNTIPLEVEHLDGNPENHKADNLELLCPNCHSLTEGHTTKKDNGRRYYREHYLKVK